MEEQAGAGSQTAAECCHPQLSPHSYVSRDAQ